MINWIAWTAIALGAFLCVSNFYLSFIRYPVHRLVGASKESYRSVSGIPIIGSMLVAFSLLGLYSVQRLLPIALVLITIDTGGIHWFAGTMIYQSLRGKEGT